jgi:hypothetical protein
MSDGIRFWLLAFGFWIKAIYRQSKIENPKWLSQRQVWILDFGSKQSIGNPKSKIQNGYPSVK